MDADHALPGFLNREWCSGSEHFQKDAFEYPAPFRLVQPSKIKLRPDDARRENKRICELGLSVSQSAHDLQAHDATGQPIVGCTRMIQVTAEDDREVERTRVFVFQNLHRTRRFPRSDHDLIIAWDKLVEDSLRDAESPVSTPAPELLTIVKRNRVVIAVIVIEVASEFFQTYRSGKALREPDHPKRMRGAIIDRAAVFDDSGLLDIPRRRNHPAVVLVGTRHGDHAKRKHLAQIIHGLIIAQRTNRSIERREVPQDLHHGFHARLQRVQLCQSFNQL